MNIIKYTVKFIAVVKLDNARQRGIHHVEQTNNIYIKQYAIWKNCTKNHDYTC